MKTPENVESSEQRVASRLTIKRNYFYHDGPFEVFVKADTYRHAWRMAVSHGKTSKAYRESLREYMREYALRAVACARKVAQRRHEADAKFAALHAPNLPAAPAAHSSDLAGPLLVTTSGPAQPASV